MKIPSLTKELKIPFYLSLALHAIIIVFVFAVFSIPTEVKNVAMQPGNPAPSQPIVQAITINSADVQQEMKRIQDQAMARKAAQQAAQQKLAQQQAQLREQQQRAAAAMAALKSQQAALAKAQAAEQQKLAQQQAQAKRQQAEQALQAQADAEQKSLAAARAKQVASTVDKYNALILNAIYPNFIVNPKQKDLSTDVLISVAPDGTVLNVSVQQTSGVTVFDRAAVSAVYKSSPLPVPKDPQAFAVFKQFKLTLKPINIVNTGN